MGRKCCYSDLGSLGLLTLVLCILSPPSQSAAFAAGRPSRRLAGFP